MVKQCCGTLPGSRLTFIQPSRSRKMINHQSKSARPNSFLCSPQTSPTYMLRHPAKTKKNPFQTQIPKRRKKRGERTREEAEALFPFPTWSRPLFLLFFTTHETPLFLSLSISLLSLSPQSSHFGTFLLFGLTDDEVTVSALPMPTRCTNYPPSGHFLSPSSACLRSTATMRSIVTGHRIRLFQEMGQRIATSPAERSAKEFSLAAELATTVLMPMPAMLQKVSPGII